jgi:protein-arginine kinase activator protein McsA
MSGNGKLCYHSNNRQFIKKKKRPQKKLGGNKIDAKIDIDEKINRLFDASLLAMEDGNYELAAQLRDRAEELRKKSTNSAILRGSIKKKVKKKVKKFKKKTSYWNCD